MHRRLERLVQLDMLHIDEAKERMEVIKWMPLTMLLLQQCL